MDWREIVSLAWSSLRTNRLRSLLTMLGMIIGVSAVITMVSIGQGARSEVARQIEGLGSNLIIVKIGAIRNISRRLVRTASLQFTVEEAMMLGDKCPSVERVAPITSFDVSLKFSSTSTRTVADGVGLDYLDMRNLRVGYGRPFTEVEMLERSRVLLLGKTIAEDLFPSDEPLGQTVKVNGFPFVVIGIMEGKGEVMGVDYDYRAYLPVTAAQRLSGNLQITTVYLKARSGELVDSAVSEVETILIRKYNNPDSFSIKSQEEILTTVRTVAAILTVMLGGIATVSLLVGGIGIMNIMLVSVTERTREIGLRKAVGAKSRDVMQQFLVEAFVLTMAGAALGIFLGVSGSSLVLALLQWPVFISWTAILVSVAFSAGTGLFFGLYPAQKAAALDPIVALRYE